MKAFLAALGLHEASLIAGLIGALVAALRMNGHWMQRVGKFFVGFAIALWIPGLIIKWLGLPHEPQFYGALGFVSGYFGLTIIDALQETLESMRRHLAQVDWKAIATGWLSRK